MVVAREIGAAPTFRKNRAPHAVSKPTRPFPLRHLGTHQPKPGTSIPKLELRPFQTFPRPAVQEQTLILGTHDLYRRVLQNAEISHEKTIDFLFVNNVHYTNS